MQTTQLSREHYSIQDDGEILKVTIHVPKNYLLMLLLGLWLIFWTFAEISVVTREIPRALDEDLFMWIWLFAFTAGGVGIVVVLLWLAGGKEITEVGIGSIKIKRAVFGLGCTKEYPAKKIGHLRISALSPDIWKSITWQKERNYWSNIGTISFDYEWQIIRFGYGIDGTEAREIIERIIGRFPKYGVRK